MSSSVINGIWLKVWIWALDFVVSLGLCSEVEELLVLGGISSDAFSSFEKSIFLHIGTVVLGGTIHNVLNPRPNLGGHHFVVIGSIIPCF